MKILIDMNLSPDWTEAFAAGNIESVHWSAVGDPRAEDTEIIEYAQTNGYIVFTHDLDFGTILALTHAAGPSVIQVRAQAILPASLANIVISVIRENEPALDRGALIVSLTRHEQGSASYRCREIDSTRPPRGRNSHYDASKKYNLSLVR